MPIVAPRRAALLLAAATALPLAALAPVAAFAQDASKDQAAAQAEAPDPDMVVATVDGTDITLGEIILMRANLPDQYRQIPDPQLMQALIDQAVVQTLLAEKGREAGKDETRMARLTAEIGAKSFLAQQQVQDIVAAATTEEKLQAAYEKAVAEAEPVEEVRASHILVEDKAEAEDLLKQIEDGADFAELAKTHGTDGTKANGGDLGWFTKDQMVAPFAEAAFEAEDGAVVGPVETQFGWHLIHVTGKREKPAPTFDEMRPELEDQLGQAAAEAAVDAIRDGADVTIVENLPDPATIRREDLLVVE